MNTLETIFTRKSVRQFKNQKVDEKDIKTVLKAGMSGPTCVNSKDWSFIVVDDPEVLHKMYQANGVPAKPLLECAFAILICGDYSKAFKFSKDYFAVDGSIAGQNMILAAWSLGIGSVWLGTWPQMDRVFAQSNLFDLPNDQIPHSIIAFGYPLDEIKEKEEVINEKHEIFSDISANSIECIPYILKEIQSNIFRFRKNHKPIPDFFYKLPVDLIFLIVFLS